MTDAPRIALLAIGDEILAGRTINTGSATLARALAAAGYRVPAVEVVGDHEPTIVASIRRLLADNDALVTTGGLGPTPDDCTRDAIAEAAGVEIVTDPGLLEAVVKVTGGLAPELNQKQAEIPAGAATFPNPVGVAAMFRSLVDGKPVYALPGVPSEMRALMDGALLPDLAKLLPAEAPEIASVSVFGMREAVMAEQLGPLLHRGTQPVVGVTVREGVLTITATGPGARQRIEDVRAHVGAFVCEGANLAEGAFFALRDACRTVSVAESLTGGLIADAFVSLPGASTVFVGGVIAYTPEMKHLLLGIEPDVIKQEGIVSETVARAMARGIRERTGADYGVGTTGAAGPTAESDGTNPGVGHIAVVGPGGREFTKHIRTVGERNAVRRRFANAALDLLRRALKDS